LEASYTPPVARLLTLGEALARRAAAPSYLELGVGAADVAELIRMAGDPALHEAAPESDDVFGPVHAWRALGQLRAAEAAEPLVRVLEERHDDDWVFEGIPEALGMIGPAALEPAAALLRRGELDLYLRVAAARSVSLAGKHHPGCRDAAIAILTRQLEAWREQWGTLNAFLVSYLIDLRAVAAAPLMRAAFAEKGVDVSVAGDWEDVQVSLGAARGPHQPTVAAARAPRAGRPAIAAGPRAPPRRRRPLCRPPQGAEGFAQGEPEAPVTPGSPSIVRESGSPGFLILGPDALLLLRIDTDMSS
jgi:hypothetical protein